MFMSGLSGISSPISVIPATQAPGCRKPGAGFQESNGPDTGLRRYDRCQRGVSLIEALVTIVILSFALLGLAFLQAQGMKSNTGAYARTQATILAYDILDRIRANPANAASYESTGASGTCSATTATADNDLICWYTTLAAALPGSSASIVHDEAILDRIAINVTINWTNQIVRKLASDTSTTNTVPQTLTINTEIPLPI
jgi:type IV pilus assembly protein PilV